MDPAKMIRVGAILAVLGWSLLGSAVASADPDSSPQFQSPSDALEAGARDWLELMNAADPIRWDHEPSPEEDFEAKARRQDRVITLALRFFKDHPQDPRRWRAALFVISADPELLSVPGGAAPASPAPNPDPPKSPWSAETWRAECDRLVTVMHGKPGAPLSYQEEADYMGFVASFRAEAARRAQGLAADDTGLLAQFERHLSRYGGSAELGGVLGDRAADFLSGLAQSDPAAALVAARQLESSKVASVQEAATVKARVFASAGKPFELKFTAIDGRTVDLAQWRGKLVLLDFWATWCGPCREALPELKRLYATYHSRGFEVIGISLDLPGSQPKLEAFCRANDMPWPQYYDGQYWKTRPAFEQGLASIPTTILLGQDGRPLGTNLRGESLEAAIEQHLRRTE